MAGGARLVVATMDGPAENVITRLEPQRRDPERVNLYLDGAFAFGLTKALVEERGLRVGRALTPADVAALRADEEVARATDRALLFLTHRPRSVREVRDRLAKQDVEPAVIDAVLARLAAWGYVGDADFARYWVENRATHQPRGKRLLQQELWRKGVARETVEQVLDESALDEAGAALALARKRRHQLRVLDEAAQRRRLVAYLQRRGYDYPTIKQALDTLFGDVADAADLSEAFADSDSYGYEG